MKRAVTAVHVQLGIVTFYVLILVVELDVAIGASGGGGIVIFHVVSAQAHVAINKVHVTVGEIEVALTTLRSAGGQFRYLPGRDSEANLLGEEGSRAESAPDENEQQAQTERTGFGTIGMHAAYKLNDAKG
jgi:hypothetical protein